MTTTTLTVALFGVSLVLAALVALWVLQGMYRMAVEVATYAARFAGCMLLWTRLQGWTDDVLVPLLVRWQLVLEQQPAARIGTLVVVGSGLAAVLAYHLFLRGPPSAVTTKDGTGRATSAVAALAPPTRTQRVLDRLGIELWFAVRFAVCHLVWLRYAAGAGALLVRWYSWLDALVLGASMGSDGAASSAVAVGVGAAAASAVPSSPAILANASALAVSSAAAAPNATVACPPHDLVCRLLRLLGS